MIYLITNQTSIEVESSIQLVSISAAINYFKDSDSIAVDLETEGFDPYTCQIKTIQLGDYQNQYVIDCQTIDIKLLKDLLESKELIFQNAKFDLRFLFHASIIPTKIWDTFLAECVINTGIKEARKSLDFLASKYLNIYLDKSFQSKVSNSNLTHRMVKYAAEDVAYLHLIREKQQIELDVWDLNIVMRLENRFVIALAYIEYSGFKLDRNKWSEKMKIDQKLYNESKLELDEYIYTNNLQNYIDNQLDLFSTERKCKINWASSKQVIKLFEELGVSVIIKDKDGKEKKSVEAPVLEPQKAKFPILPIYLKYKQREKVVSTYGESFLRQINPITGKLHTQFRQIMDTGRLSSGGKDKSTGLEAINFQNIPSDSETRSCFTAKEGNTLIVCDYSQQEQVILANKCQDQNILDFFNSGAPDMHSYNASKMFPHLKGIPLNEIKEKYKKERTAAKSAGFALNYGGNGKTIAENLNISKTEGDEIYKAYFRAFPGLLRYFETVSVQTIELGYVFINGVTRRKSFISFLEDFKIFGEKSPTYFKQAGMIYRKSLNFPIQGSSADVTKLATVYLMDYLIEKDLLFKVFIPNTIHDEIVIECPIEMSEELAVVLKECMERASVPFCPIIPMKAEPEITPFWKK